MLHGYVYEKVETKKYFNNESVDTKQHCNESMAHASPLIHLNSISSSLFVMSLPA